MLQKNKDGNAMRQLNLLIWENNNLKSISHPNKTVFPQVLQIENTGGKTKISVISNFFYPLDKLQKQSNNVSVLTHSY